MADNGFIATMEGTSRISNVHHRIRMGTPKSFSFLAQIDKRAMSWPFSAGHFLLLFIAKCVISFPGKQPGCGQFQQTRMNGHAVPVTRKSRMSFAGDKCL
jgi:hypothetical protein